MRFNDFFSKENSLYARYAQEIEKNQVLQQHISIIESGSLPDGLSAERTSLYYNTHKSDYVDTENPRQSSTAFINLANNTYYRDTIEQDKQHQRQNT